ncbi:helix-turn-helix domain-containing protein [Streptomyces violens]|uniref:helix-turn-helix domain-containing protein n=1 Tax=Streptomyces violens TaxID=66377 RepID=UPI0004BF832A|nr:helix-turn-helix transcriptional regulator [Streptomyces violens]
MANCKSLDPGASPLDYFGAELRRLREEAGLTLEQLGKLVYLTGSMIGQIETAAKMPKDEHIPRLDETLGAKGALVRLWDLVRRSKLPYKHRRVTELQSSARRILAFQPQVVYGLLQTPEYARAVLGVLDKEGLDDRVEAWLARQRILEGAKPPLLWVVMGEGVLYQEIGGREVMRKQLAHLLSYRDSRHVHIQVLPYSAGAHAGLVGAFSLFSYRDQADIVYAEGYGGAEPTANPESAEDCSLRYDHLQSAALAPNLSAELIARVMEERYGHAREPGPRPVA